MAIQPICDSCQQELTIFGAILLGPPDAKNQVHKYHLCQQCYVKVKKDLNLDSPKTA
ncbi:MAG: hypothetical protein ABI392_00515 [Candidatus Saccharimonadales bacterium]